MVASEGRPFAKTGGLADVIGALPQALARLGHRVTIVLPKYRGTHTDGAEEKAVGMSRGEIPDLLRFAAGEGGDSEAVLDAERHKREPEPARTA